MCTSSKISEVKGKPFTRIDFLIEKVDPEVDLQVAVRLFNVAPTKIGSEVQHQEMSEASTSPIETQACAACPLSVEAQNAQESKLWEFIICACKALRAIYAGWWLSEEWGQRYFVVWMPIRYHFGGGVKHKTGLQSALKSSCCQKTKTIRPAVEELHCCITKVDSIQCFANSPLTESNWFYAWMFVFEDRHLFWVVTGAAGYCPITPPSSLRYQNKNICLYILSW